jgi:hypothetical protein
MALKAEAGSGMREAVTGGCWFLWFLCVFWYISVVVVKGALSGIAGVWSCVKLV